MEYKWQRTFSNRWLILFAMALCIYFLLVSDDMMHRAIFLVFLIILEQIRDWSLLSALDSAKKQGRGEK
jgi:hypothetical protein